VRGHYDEGVARILSPVVGVGLTEILPQKPGGLSSRIATPAGTSWALSVTASPLFTHNGEC
jgi:hypothetical protein